MNTRISFLSITKTALAAGSVLVSHVVQAQEPGTIPYSATHVITASDTPEIIVEKAAKTLPRANQTEWMRLERTFFLHYGPNTFRGVEWGSGREDPAIFNPTSLDANQWVTAMKNAGGKMVILVCKHHDGLCLWQTRYTKHSVASSPWMDGKGDEVKAVSEAAQAQGLKLGVYLSPADLYQLRTNPKNPAGYYGNGSAKVKSTIPTNTESFQSDPSQGRKPIDGIGSFEYTVDDYNRYFLNQLYELLTEYGPVSVVWFDGANPDPSVEQTYDYAAWYDLIRKLAPNAVISVKGPDSRWVGNEGGVGRETEWSVLPLPESEKTFTWPDLYGADLGSRSRLVPGSHLWWYPAEVNTPILYGWFWAAGKGVKSASELIDYYYRSVGRNGNMLLNLSPDTRGLIPDDQLSVLSQMAQVVNDTFAINLAQGASLSADNYNDAYRPDFALDSNEDTWWETAAGRNSGSLVLNLPKAVTFDVVSLQEAVDHRSQRVETFAIDVWDGNAWTSIDEQTTIGHKRLLRLEKPVTTQRVRIRITKSRLEPTISEVGLFKQAISIPAPTISERDSQGQVFISNPEMQTIVYTTDGTLPTAESSVYKDPISMIDGGIVQAARLTTEGKLGMIAYKTFTGIAPIGWKSINSQEAKKAIDGNASSIWNAGEAAPQVVTVDMGTPHCIRGFTYLPRQDKSLNGIVESYRFEVSADGKHWTTVIDEGHFGNIRNNPDLHEVVFQPQIIRYFRFTALKVLEGGNVSAAEISVLAAEGN
ncbi:MAG: alpha-L-fucosidase [Opitutales bacterium]|nr:alpha-L-fucosidase [Opitutales bacterium]